MADDRVKILEERLTRLEAAFTQQQPSARAAYTSPNMVVDPAPYPYQYYPRPYPRPVVDPAPYPYPYPYPRPVVDPAPYSWWGGGHTVSDPAPFHNPIVDPAASVEHLRATVSAAGLGHIGHLGGDPPPIDVSRLSAAQLESMLHTISAERSRLDSMETLIRQQHERLSRSREEEL